MILVPLDWGFFLFFSLAGQAKYGWLWSAGSMIYVMRQQSWSTRGPEGNFTRGFESVPVHASWLAVQTKIALARRWCGAKLQLRDQYQSVPGRYAVLVAGPTRFMGLSSAPAWQSDGLYPLIHPPRQPPVQAHMSPATSCCRHTRAFPRTVLLADLGSFYEGAC